MWLAGFLLVLGPLVTLHELGHYLVGRWFGVQAQAFSVGFGKELIGRTDRRGTRWKLSALPLGGYVQFKGDMNPASIPGAAERGGAIPAHDGSFHTAPLHHRALIVAAGPAMNFLIALAIFTAFNLSFGKLDAPATIGAFAPQSVARDAGLAVGDRIVAIDGERVDGFEDLTSHVLLYPGREVTLVAERDGRELVVPLRIAEVVETDRFGNTSRIGRIGVAAAQPRLVPVGPVEAVVEAARQTWGTVTMMVAGLRQILTGERGVDELGGPIKIAKYSGEQLSLGPLAFVQFVALISINLAFINLLPIPALDGGHLAFYAAEAVRRKPIGPRGQEWAYRTGVALVLALMLFVTANDITSLLRG